MEISYVFYAVALPVLLRKSEVDDIYHIVGGAGYVHGVMFREAMEMANKEGKSPVDIWIS